ncbi:hypothetical protein ACXR2U_18540, partial [Jatrophihabitans sp. YIM 134969]
MGRHALLEAPDVPTVTPAPAAATCSSEVRTVAEIIAAFRREQGLATLPARSTQPDTDDHTEIAVDPVVIGPWSTTDVHDASGTTDATDEDGSDDDLTGPSGPESAGSATVRDRRDAAWQAALRPTGSRPAKGRRRSASGSTASAVIASLTAELAASHPGLLEGTPHSRRAEPAARRVAPA